MSLKGVRQLKQLTIRYSDIDGSSRGMRAWMRSKLVDFAKENPDISIVANLRRNRHPYLRGEYKNGNSKTIDVKNIEEERVNTFVFDLRDQIGRKISSNGYKKPILSETPSIQGEWHERMDLIDLQLKITHR